MTSLKELIQKWEAENKELERFVRAFGEDVPPSAIIDYKTRKKCIDELDAYRLDVLKNGSINH